ncbi:hypothetical protein D3C85_1596090 [compost metagenome]
MFSEETLRLTPRSKNKVEVLYGQKHLASHCLVIEVHNLPLLLMVGTDWVKNIRTNEVKWDANVNASTRFAINSEWQYMGTAVL